MKFEEKLKQLVVSSPDLPIICNVTNRRIKLSNLHKHIFDSELEEHEECSSDEELYSLFTLAHFGSSLFQYVAKKPEPVEIESEIEDEKLLKMLSKLRIIADLDSAGSIQVQLYYGDKLLSEDISHVKECSRPSYRRREGQIHMDYATGVFHQDILVPRPTGYGKGTEFI